MPARILALVIVASALSACTALDILSDPEKAARDAARDATEKAVREARDEAVEEAARAVGDALMARYRPQMLSWLSQVAVHNPMAHLAQSDEDFAPGDYTEWELISEEDTAGPRMRRAYLGPSANGGQWWQMHWWDAQGQESMIIESLLDAETGQTRRLLMQGQGESSPREIDLSEAEAQAPTRLDPDALAAQAEERRETIRVPAGRFDTRRLRVGEPEQGYQSWWLSDAVPGQVVQFRWQDESEQTVMRLIDYGSGARSRLRDGD